MISHSYHSLDIKNSCALINLLLCSDGASWELNVESPFKLHNMVVDIPIQSCDLHQLGRVYLTKPFDIHRPSFLVNSMVSLRIVLQHFINFFEFKLLRYYKSQTESVSQDQETIMASKST